MPEGDEAESISARGQKQESEWQNTADSWEGMNTEGREKLLKDAGWVTSKGGLNPTGKKLLNSSFAGLSLAAKKIIRDKINKGDKTPTMSGENIAMDIEKMRSIKMPKEIKSKGIGSKEYKEWVEENWAKSSEKQPDKREITSQEPKNLDKKDFPESIITVISNINFTRAEGGDNRKDIEYKIDKKDIKDGFELFGEKFVIARNQYGSWEGYEVSTGARLGSGSEGKTIKEARENSIKKLKMIGDEKVKSSVKNYEKPQLTSEVIRDVPATSTDEGGKEIERTERFPEVPTYTEPPEGFKIIRGTNAPKGYEFYRNGSPLKPGYKQVLVKDKPLQKASELLIGTKVESEHDRTIKFIADYLKKNNRLPSNEEIHKSIAKDHHYYTRLNKMESEAEKEMSKAVNALEQELQKGKAMPIGTISNGRKKVAEGKWVPVKDGKEKKPSPDNKEKKPGEKPEEKSGLSEDKKSTIKNALKKMANILAEALSGRDVNQPTGAAVEQTGETLQAKSKMLSQKKKDDKNKKQIPEG
jgi:hypothetical protein